MLVIVRLRFPFGLLWPILAMESINKQLGRGWIESKYQIQEHRQSRVLCGAELCHPSPHSQETIEFSAG
jgi:hypothetical protein